jgi:hypothetical protein
MGRISWPPTDELRDSAAAGQYFRYINGQFQVVPLHETPISKIAPFIEQMGPMSGGGRKEFWWEREWRKVGNLVFTWRSVVCAFAPETEHNDIANQLRSISEHEDLVPQEPPRLLDPRWGLERMIARLAGIPDTDAGPLPSY